MLSEYNFKHFNFRLLIYVLALNLIGVLVINSAVYGDEEYISKQLIGLFGGLVIALGISLINYKYLMKVNGLIYLGCILILVAVIISGKVSGGSKRWITLPLLGRFQPSEFVKIGLIIFFSWFLQKNQEKINQPSTLLLLAALAAVPLLLIMNQPDLSTSIVIAFFIVCLIYITGISYKWIFGALAVAFTGIGGLILMLELDLIPPFLRGYQLNRILAFRNPEMFSDLMRQQENSKMAIGSGQLYGKGLFNNTFASVKSGNFVSEGHTDFIFSIIGEELGFVGCMVVLALFLLLIYECLHTAARSRDLAGKLLCSGYAALIGFQTFANIGVATGILPNTGLPLPFISYGVSSLVSLYIGIGIVLNVGLQYNKPEI